MGRLVKYLVIIAILAAGGLYGYSYLLKADVAPVSLVVPVDVD